ncbi:MAG: hypothetical protein HQK69_03440 [Desulfamplus sp.]|nr:hypothetical protein [Desulfamplus sp.]
MKKTTIVLIAAICAVMFVAPVYADDKVAISGGFRVRAWDTKNQDFGGSDNSYFDQRLRIGTKINVADDVTVQLRADWADATWGDGFNGGLITRPRAKATNTLDIDRAFVDIKKEMWSLRAGQQYMGLGVNKVLDANVPGFKFDLNFAPVTTSLLYAKIDENGSLSDEATNQQDEDFYALNVNYTCDVFNGNLFVGAKNDDTDVEDSPVMVGIQGTGKLGMVNLTSELAMASGDTNKGKTDYTGTQFYLGVDSNVSDAVNLGAEIVYALGTTDANETQFTGFCNWWTFTPMSMNTPFSGEFAATPTADIFDPTGDSAGVQGITVQAKYTPMDIVALGAKFGYFQPEEDTVTTVDDITSFNVWATYTIATNTQLWITYLYSDPEVQSGAADIDPEKILVTQLEIAF